jgi:(R,R)-butanediol dehydrogenase/meso-butanediol dehydrogenase/diacetyl reductase
VNALVIRAKREPLSGVDYPGPHQIYRWPQLKIEKRSLVAVPAGHLRVEMKLVGVCGTDLHAVKYDPSTGYILGTAPLDIGSDGRILGHEGIGQVAEIGSGVEGFQRGNWVVFESLQACHSCESCRRGRFNQCTNAVLVGMQRDGLFAELADIPAQMAHNVSDLTKDKTGQQAAACIEPAACSLVALSTARLRPGDDIVIFGAGPIGYFAAMLSRLAFGAASIQVVEPLPFRREFAKKWADRVSDVEEFFAESSWRDADVLIEASGQSENVNQALSRLRPNGRIILIGRYGKPLTLQGVDRIITNNLSIIGSRGHLGGAFGDLLRLYYNERIPLHDAVTGTEEGLANLKRALEDNEELPEKHCKLLAKLK